MSPLKKMNMKKTSNNENNFLQENSIQSLKDDILLNQLKSSKKELKNI